MALTEDRLKTTATTPLRTPPVAPPEAPSRLEPLSKAWLAVIGLAWLVLFPLAIQLQPVPAKSEIAWWDYAVSYTLLAGLAVMAAGLGSRKRWGTTASLGASGLFLAMTFACPATGHHEFGVWWFGQLAIALTLVATSAVAYLKTSE